MDYFRKNERDKKRWVWVWDMFVDMRHLWCQGNACLVWDNIVVVVVVVVVIVLLQALALTLFNS